MCVPHNYIVTLAKSHDFVKGLTISYLAHTLRSWQLISHAFWKYHTLKTFWSIISKLDGKINLKKMPSSHIWLVNVWHLVSCLIGGVNRHIGWYIGWVSGECRLTYQLIYRPSIGGYIDQVSVQCWLTVDQVSMDVSVNRWSTVSHDSIGSMCQCTVGRVSAMYIYWWCIG